MSHKWPFHLVAFVYPILLSKYRYQCSLDFTVSFTDGSTILLSDTISLEWHPHFIALAYPIILSKYRYQCSLDFTVAFTDGSAILVSDLVSIA